MRYLTFLLVLLSCNSYATILTVTGAHGGVLIQRYRENSPPDPMLLIGNYAENFSYQLPSHDLYWIYTTWPPDAIDLSDKVFYLPFGLQHAENWEGYWIPTKGYYGLPIQPAIPEPATYLMLLAGLGYCYCVKRRHLNRSSSSGVGAALGT